MRETAWKNPAKIKYGWKKNQELNEENFKEEIVDLWHFAFEAGSGHLNFMGLGLAKKGALPISLSMVMPPSESTGELLKYLSLINVQIQMTN